MDTAAALRSTIKVGQNILRQLQWPLDESILLKRLLPSLDRPEDEEDRPGTTELCAFSCVSISGAKIKLRLLCKGRPGGQPEVESLGRLNEDDVNKPDWFGLLERGGFVR